MTCQMMTRMAWATTTIAFFLAAEWERPVAMQLWQMDVTASAFLADGREVKIITGIGDHSRYCVIAKAVMRATARPVCQAFLGAMGTYGVPGAVLPDNGTVFTGRFIKPRPGEVLFERICRENGITQRLTKPASPATTGKIGRPHQSLQTSCLMTTGSSSRSRPCRPLWTRGGRSTTPAGRTSRWAWHSRYPGSGLPRRHWNCAQPARAWPRRCQCLL
jgi:transposase InsO family protein